MGAVYLAEDEQLARTVALKILPRDKAENVTLARRFKAEGQAAAKLNHPNIVKVHEAGEINGQAYMALEYIAGTDAHKLLVRKGRLSPEKALAIVRQVAEALAHAEELGIVHRDIKPSNLLIDGEGHVKLADMGLARSIADTEEAGITRAGTTVGTVDFMPPEQARDSKAADVRSDIYALGGTWYQLLTGQVPFPGGDLMNKLKAHAQQSRPDPRKLNESIPEAMSAVLRRMMAVRPEQRHQSVSELIADLESLKNRSTAVVDAIFDDLPVVEDDGTEVEIDGEHAGLEEEDSGASVQSGGKSKRAGSKAKKRKGKKSAKDALPPRQRRAESVAGDKFDIEKAKQILIGLCILAAVGGTAAVTLMLASGGDSGSVGAKPNFPQAEGVVGDDIPQDAPKPDIDAPAEAPVAAVEQAPASAPPPMALPTWAEAMRDSRETPDSVVRVESSPLAAASSRRSLVAALDALPQDGGRIELVDAGPHTLLPTVLDRRGTLQLVAAQGVRPVVQIPIDETTPEAVLSLTQTDLVVDGVHLMFRDMRRTPLAAALPPVAAIGLDGGSVELRNSSVTAPPRRAGEADGGLNLIAVSLTTGRSGRTLRRSSSGRLLVAGSVLAGASLQPIELDCDGADLAVDRSVLIGGGRPAVAIRPGPKRDSRLVFVDSVVATDGGSGAVLFDGASAPASTTLAVKGGRLAVAGDGAAIQTREWAGDEVVNGPKNLVAALDPAARLRLAESAALLASENQSIDTVAAFNEALRSELTDGQIDRDESALSNAAELAASIGLSGDALPPPEATARLAAWSRRPRGPVAFVPRTRATFDPELNGELADFLESPACGDGCTVELAGSGAIELGTCRLVDKAVRLVPSGQTRTVRVPSGELVTLRNSSVHLFNLTLESASAAIFDADATDRTDAAGLVLDRCRVSLPGGRLSQSGELQLDAAGCDLQVAEGLREQSVRLQNCLVRGNAKPMLGPGTVAVETTFALSAALLQPLPQGDLVWIESSVIAADPDGSGELPAIVAAAAASQAADIDWVSDRVAVEESLTLAELGTASLPLTEESWDGLLPNSPRTLLGGVASVGGDTGDLAAYAVSAGSLAATASESVGPLGCDLDRVGPIRDDELPVKRRPTRSGASPGAGLATDGGGTRGPGGVGRPGAGSSTGQMGGRTVGGVGSAARQRGGSASGGQSSRQSNGASNRQAGNPTRSGDSRPSDSGSGGLPPRRPVRREGSSGKNF